MSQAALKNFRSSTWVVWNPVTGPARAYFSPFFLSQEPPGYGSVLHEESTPIREHILPHHMKSTSQNGFALIFMRLIIWSYFRSSKICQRSKVCCFPSPPFSLLHDVHSSGGQTLTFVHIFHLLSFVWTKWNTRWTSMTRTPSSTASGTLRAAWAPSQTRGTQRTICRRACRCCLSWAPTLCSPWFYANGQCVEQRSVKWFSYPCWQSFAVQTICAVCGTICACVCAARARGVPRTSRSSMRSCSTSRLPPISPPL